MHLLQNNRIPIPYIPFDKQKPFHFLLHPQIDTIHNRRRFDIQPALDILQWYTYSKNTPSHTITLQAIIIQFPIMQIKLDQQVVFQFRLCFVYYWHKPGIFVLRIPTFPSHIIFSFYIFSFRHFVLLWCVR